MVRALSAAQWVLLTLVLALVCCSVLAGCGSATSTGSTVFVATNGNDSNPCTAAAPCLSLNRAYAVATPGSAVSIAPGTYARQRIRAIPSRTNPAAVVFLGNAANFGEVDVFASHIELRDLNVGGWEAERGASYVTFRDVNSTSTIFVNSANNVRVIGGVIDGAGRYWNNGSQVKTLSPTAPQPANISFDHVTIKNFLKNPAVQPTPHVDCLHVMSAQGITIRNSYFTNCEAFDVLFTVYLGTTPTNILIENNEFHCCHTGYYSLYLGGGHGENFQHAMIRNNSSDNAFTVGTTNTASDVVFVNNDVPGIGGCDRSGITADYNVLYATSIKCPGAHNVYVPSGFVSATDEHLVAGAAAIGNGSSNQPATDRNGNTRDATPDIGAYERHP